MGTAPGDRLGEFVEQRVVWILEIGGVSHYVYRSHPKQVASLIKQASLGAADPGAGRADAPSRTPRQ